MDGVPDPEPVNLMILNLVLFQLIPVGVISPPVNPAAAALA